MIFCLFVFSCQSQCHWLPAKARLQNDPIMCGVGHKTLFTLWIAICVVTTPVTVEWPAKDAKYCGDVTCFPVTWIVYHWMVTVVQLVNKTLQPSSCCKQLHKRIAESWKRIQVVICYCYPVMHSVSVYGGLCLPLCVDWVVLCSAILWMTMC